jgi:hypothetical protein
MFWRKWIVRGVVYGMIALCGGASIAYQRWTNPGAVREQVIAKLHELFPGAQVSVDSARLRILGGIQLNGLRFSRRDDPDHNEFLQVPSAVFYHDKEKILDGELALRKIELHKPRLRVRRDANGRWNVENLTGELRPDRQIPTVVVHQGTILFEDRGGDATVPDIEIGDVNVTVINDPLVIVTVRGAATSAALGKLQVNGNIRRDPLELAVAFQAQGVPISTPLVRRFAGNARPELLEGLVLTALADVHGQVSFHPGPVAPLDYDLHCSVRAGTLQHPQLPLPFENVAADIHCTAGRVHVENFTARSGAVKMRADAMGLLPAPERDFEARLEIKHLVLDQKLCSYLPPKLRPLNDLFKPTGPITIHVACARQDGAWTSLADDTPTRVALRPEGAAICFVKFPYPVQQLTGALDYTVHNRRLIVKLAGQAGGQPVSINGVWQGEGVQAEADIDIEGNNVPIDETLLTALPDSAQKIARSFHGTGQANIKAHIHHDRVSADFRNEYHVALHDATLRWDSFPYPLEYVRGLLDIYPHHWEFRDFRGQHNGAFITAKGRSTWSRTADGKPVQGIALTIDGRNLALDAELRKGLTPRPKLLDAWDKFRPHGRLNFVATVSDPTGLSDDLDVHVDAQGCAVEPKFFPYRLHDIGGQFHFHNNQLDIADLKAWHASTLLTLGRGRVDVYPGGGYFADLANMQARDLEFDENLLQALPGKLQEAARSLKLHDKVQAQARLVVSQGGEPASLPDIYWENCQVWFKKASFTTGLQMEEVSGTLACMGRHDGRQLLGLRGVMGLDRATVLKQPFQNVRLRFHVDGKAPDVLLVDVHAPVHGGDITGQVRLECNSTLRYEINLTASQIDLKQFGKHNLGAKSEIEGVAVGRIHLTGLGSGLQTLDGHGTVDVPSGKLLNFPLLFDLLKFLGLHWPDRTAFEELHALFGIHGNRVHLRKLELLGNAVSVAGNGEFNLDGSDLAIDFYPTWRIEQLLPPAVRPVPPAISKSLLTIEMRGKIGSNTEKELKFNKRWVPILTDPVINLQQRLAGETRVERKD